jgi:hypothetical protein
MRFGDAKAAAAEAGKEVAAMAQKFGELNQKEKQAGAERDQKNTFSRGLKDSESGTGRAEGRLDRYHELALGKVAADEKSGAITKEEAEATRGSITNDYDITKRGLQVAGVNAQLAMHTKAGAAGMVDLGMANRELADAEADVTGGAGKKRKYQLNARTKDVKAFEAELAETDKALEMAEKYRADNTHVKYNRSKWGSLFGWDQASAAVANLSGAFTEASTGISGDDMVGNLQGRRSQLLNSIQGAEKEVDSLSTQQKKAEDRAAAVREARNKIEAGVEEHGTAAQDAQRKLKELGEVKSYPSLDKLAKGGSSAVRQLMQLQDRLAGEDPMSVTGRNDVRRVEQLQGALAKAGLQPGKGEQDNPLNRAMTADGCLRVMIASGLD